MEGTWRCKECGNLNRETDSDCLDCHSGEWTGGPARVAVGRRYSLTEEEWETIRLSPLWTFRLVSEIDGTSDGRERDSLTAALANGQLFGSFLLREACGAIARDLEEVVSREAEDPRTIEEAFCDLGRVIDDTLSRADAEEFKKNLVELGVTIARASGGGLFGGGDRMSEVETRALSFMTTVFGIHPLSKGPGGGGSPRPREPA